MRHAKANHESVAEDHQRNLTEKGIGDCIKLAELLNAKNFALELIISSSAVRTVETATNIQQKLNIKPPIKIIDALYRADALQIVDEIKSVDDDYNNIMLVAHNPGVWEFCTDWSLYSEQNYILQLRMGFAPSCCGIFESEANSWREIKPSNTHLTSLFVP
jgi:phosphohistidine phosphatase